MIFNKTLIASALLAVLSVAAAGKAPAKAKPAKAVKIGQVGTIINGTNFCLFLPPVAGEWNTFALLRLSNDGS